MRYADPIQPGWHCQLMRYGKAGGCATSEIAPRFPLSHSVGGCYPLDSDRIAPHSTLRPVLRGFVRQGLAGQPLTVFGTGQQVRCFCHVHDVVPALTRLIASDQASGRAVNLGSTEQVTIEGLAERVIAATGSGAGIERASYLEAYGSGYEDMQRRVPDCTLAGELVGFRATRSLDEIIQAVIEDQLAWRAPAAAAS